METRADLESVRSAYEQLCISYRAIDDFRAKLLGFLPVVTGGGLLILTGRGDGLSQELFLPAGVFGVAVTLGLFAYEVYGIKKCHALIKAGVALESSLGLVKSPDPRFPQSLGPPGQFQDRPREVLGYVNEPFAAAIIYPAAVAGWAYLAAYRGEPRLAGVIAAAIFVIGFAITLEYNRRLRKDAERIGRSMATREQAGSIRGEVWIELNQPYPR
jgi:hypothetical protein